MNLQYIEQLLKESDGNHSLLFPALKDRLNIYNYQDLPYREEFLFFEDKYLSIKKDMIINNFYGEVIDIGCQLGIQSEIFLDNKKYIGIDKINSNFFNNEKENIEYIKGYFPDIPIDLNNKVVMSIMSLGFFNTRPDDNIRFVKNLQNTKRLYISTTNELLNQLRPYFNEIKMIKKDIISNKSMSKNRKKITINNQDYSVYCLSK